MKNLGLNETSSLEDVQIYWNARPCNLRHSKQQIGTKDYFREVSERRYFVESHIGEFANFSGYKDKRVLEVGCGIGTDGAEFAKNGAIYYGCDLSDVSVNLAKKRFDTFGLLGHFSVVDAEDLLSKYGEQSFDMVYSFGVIHHSPSPKAIVKQISKILRTNGEFKFMVYAKNSWKSAMIEAGLDQPEAQSGCPIAFSFDEQDVRDLLGDDFNIEKISQKHIFRWNILEYKNYNYVMEPWFREMPDAVYRALEEKFGWHLLVTARKY